MGNSFGGHGSQKPRCHALCDVQGAKQNERCRTTEQYASFRQATQGLYLLREGYGQIQGGCQAVRYPLYHSQGKGQDGDVFDVLVRADDESKINRIADRFSLTKIDTATLKAELLKEKAKREQNGESSKVSRADEEKEGEKTTKNECQDPPVPEQTEEEYEEGVAEKLLSEKPIQKEARSYANPTSARTDDLSREPVPSASGIKEKAPTESDSLSEPTSNESNKENESVSPSEYGERESVSDKIARIKKESEAASKNAPAKESNKAPTPKSNESR